MCCYFGGITSSYVYCERKWYISNAILHYRCFMPAKHILSLVWNGVKINTRICCVSIMINELKKMRPHACSNVDWSWSPFVSHKKKYFAKFAGNKSSSFIIYAGSKWTYCSMHSKLRQKKWNKKRNQIKNRKISQIMRN